MVQLTDRGELIYGTLYKLGGTATNSEMMNEFTEEELAKFQITKLKLCLYLQKSERVTKRHKRVFWSRFPQKYTLTPRMIKYFEEKKC